MSHSEDKMERLHAAEKNIEQIRESVNGLRIEEARQTEQISSIRDVLVSINANMTKMDCHLTALTTSMNNMQTTLAVNTQSLQEHMRRTEVLETHVEEFKKFQWKVFGAIAVLTIGIPFLIKFVS